MERLEGLRSSGHIDLVKWYNFFTFDVIGDLAFGKPFGCLETSSYHQWITIIFSNIRLTSYFRLLGFYPFLDTIKPYLMTKSLMNSRITHMKLSRELGLHRLNNQTDRIDFMSRMTLENGVTEKEFIGNTSLLVVAGSETTATLLSGLTYYLLMNPPVMKKLVEEIRSSFSSESEINFVTLGKLKYLMACVEEGLRRYPPVPNGLPRETAVGEDFYGYYIPPKTIISIYQYVAYHSPKHFYLPDQFIPERWLGEDQRFANDNKSVMQPFSVGPRNCIGKNLATIEIRIVLARLLYKYDLELSPACENWAEQHTFLLWEKGPLMVKLLERKS